MLVYFVNHSTAPVSLGGAERSMIALVEDWTARDPQFEPFFFTKAPRGRFIEAIEQRGWPYLALRFRGWALPHIAQPASQSAYFARDDYNATLRMIAVMEDRRPDLVVTNTVVAPWGAFAAKALGIPHAWFVREYGDLDHGLEFQLGREQTFQDIGSLSEVVFVNSEGLKKHVEPFIEAAKLGIVYPRIDLDSISRRALEAPATAPFPRDDDGSLRVTVVGRLSESKGQHEVIRAVAILRTRGVIIRLCLVGGSEPRSYERTLVALAKDLGVGDQVVFAGEQENPFPFILAADVCVTASGIEAFGRTTYEYLALGKPVIALATGGSIELIEDGVTGFLVPPGDPGAFANALERCANDRPLVGSLSRAASRRAREIASTRYSNDAAIDRLIATSKQPASRLPNMARYWFGLPAMMIDGAGSDIGTTARFVAGRLVRRARGFVGRGSGSRT